MTYSIVARDPETGELGVAVQSHYFNVGPVVAWVRAGVGAVATQSLVLPAYGPRGLERMAAGASAAAALAALLAEDADAAVRQVAMVDAAGRAAVHTGARCIGHAGHLQGDSFTVEANMMRHEGVPEAMAAAFRSATGTLAERLVVALQAAEDAGGDVRGRQSAAVRVVRGESTGDEAADLLVDLRVEDHPYPVPELARLVRMHRGYRLLNDYEDAQLAGGNNNGGLVEEALALVPDNVELGYWWGIELVKEGRDADARPLLDRAFAADPGWRALVPRLVPAGILADDADLVRRILGN
jgi:uncharacterized Ntn-hydrolase superfamily protein